MDTTFDLNRLRLLVALDETRSVGRAAELLNMSQSGFSTALGKLRLEFEDEIFVRTGSRMEPTTRGTLMAQTARKVLEDVQLGVLAPVAFDPARSQAEFTLAMADVSEVAFLPRLVERLQAVAPRVTLRSVNLAQAPLEAAFAAGEIDLALGYFPDLNERTHYAQLLYEHSYACLHRQGHPCEGRMTMQAYEACGHVVSGSPIRANRFFDDHLQAQGIKRRIVLRTPHHLSMPAIIESTDLIASLPLGTAQRFASMARVQVSALPFEVPAFPIHQHWHRVTHHDAKNQWLRGQVKELFGQGGRA